MPNAKSPTPATALCACLLLLGAHARAAEPSPGARLYANHCAACHGASGEGDGPVAAVMQVGVPNLRTLAERNGGKFPAEAVARYIDGRQVPASHGDRQMPIWGDVFSAEANAKQGGGGESEVRQRIAAIVAFIAEIQYH